MTNQKPTWPALPLGEWEATYDTLHMYAQIAGKVALALRPMTNHWWQVALELSAHGLTTGAIPYGDRTFSVELDLIEHVARIDTSEDERRTVPLGGPVREFYAGTTAAFADLGIDVPIWPKPVEVADPIPFDRDDRHATYDPGQVERYWHVLRHVGAVFEEFRARFTGKASPVQFYWGSFDLAATRYSGRPTDPPPNADVITRFSFTAEQSAVGFWPGGTAANGARVDEAVFFAYTYPEPRGIRDYPVEPAAARFHPDLGEFVLAYEDVRTTPEPARVILDFAQSAYEAGARLQDWPRELLEWAPPMPPTRRRALAHAGGR
ncbi:hypothetical protein Drose_19545 [Dactylosporangium roseum]|uniref:Ava_C0101 and related proteins n=1 Tax=Dactylosporangium roseum TaxID=47989 RepID=A0ABY5YZ45_9ACTN|nr:DUF5996 family protein [Dactylosporangium roseum]UWZ33509.1 hypothetical protein Drose_19545 [Dactylosporangium roseum]